MSVSYRLGFKIVISVLEWGRVKRFGWRKIRRRVQVIVASNGTIPGTNYISAGSYLQVIFLLLRFTTVACHEYPIVIAMVHSYSPIPSSQWTLKRGWKPIPNLRPRAVLTIDIHCNFLDIDFGQCEWRISCNLWWYLLHLCQVVLTA